MADQVLDAIAASREETIGNLENLIADTRKKMKEAFDKQDYATHYELKNNIYRPAANILIDLDRASLREVVDPDFQELTDKMKKINGDMKKNIEEIKKTKEFIDTGTKIVAALEEVIKIFLKLGFL